MIIINQLDSVLDFLNDMNKNFLIKTLNIKFIHVDITSLTAKMPIKSFIQQFDGLVNGGYALVLAETVGSSLSFIHVDKIKYQVLGMNISINHLIPIRNGYLYAKACFIKKGYLVHTIKIELYSENNDTISFCMLTNFIKKR